MAFIFSEQHIADYYHHGYTVLRGILPPALIADLRRMSAPGRAIARAKHGPQAQRLQPLAGNGLDLKPFQDYCELAELNDALHRVLSPRHSLVGPGRAAILYEPADKPSFTGWHRDITENTPGIDREEFRRITLDPTFFTQINCALYTDVSTWYVPGSDGRPNTAAEVEAAAAIPKVKNVSDEEAERLALEYCQAMPGAVQLVLEAGDFALYRPNGWHIGNYAPYRIRATIHDGAWKPEVEEWYARMGINRAVPDEA
jgi:hypothetical protein